MSTDTYQLTVTGPSVVSNVPLFTDADYGPSCVLEVSSVQDDASLATLSFAGHDGALLLSAYLSAGSYVLRGSVQDCGWSPYPDRNEAATVAGLLTITWYFTSTDDGPVALFATTVAPATAGGLTPQLGSLSATSRAGKARFTRRL